MLQKFLSLLRYYRLRSIRVIMRELVFQVAKRLPFVRSLHTRVYDFELYVPLKIDGIGRQLFVLGGREEDHKWLMDQEIKRGDVIFDIGANIGYYAMMEAKRLGGAGKVHAIEPDPRNVEFLRNNIRSFDLGSLIDVREGAISNFDGEQEFALSKRTNLSSFNTAATTGDVTVKVRVYDFGRYIERLGRVDLVRMDVEGHEVEILESLAALLERNPGLAPRMLIFETHLYASKQQRMSDVLWKLMRHGYRAKYITSDDELATNGSVFRKYGYAPIRTISEWRVSRGIYTGITHTDAAKLISDWRGTRTVCLEFAVAERRELAVAARAQTARAH